ncbi:LCP family protein [Microbacterium sp. HD4P20]|uniref:LCP family protein n=1 Tax=Microbacterium sp. HD4P20 TaxID=2864874 RepID=UPI001C643765|nr:LCP family protein [Microbacterium sp. HD4P20]MCP2635998.1 LCP family protein [Microbacterium sp. HD4P20]
MSETSKTVRRGRRTVARHGELSSPHPLALVLKIVAVVASVVLVSTAGVAAYALTDLATGLTDDAVALEGQEDLPPPTMGAIEGVVDLVLVGTDECEEEYAYLFGDRCTGADAAGQLNDVNMLVHISSNPRRVTVVSFPRDLMIGLPSCQREDGSQSSPTSRSQINEAWSRGGLSCVAKTISELSGQNVPYAAKVSFGNVINITDALGGVDVCIGNGGMRDRYTGIDWPAGPRTVQGVEALQFLRTRHGLENGSDLARISNQQQYMSSLARKLVSDEVLSDPGTLYRLATTAVDNITASESLANPLRIAQIAMAVNDVPFEDINFIQYPVNTDPIDPDRVVPDWERADELWAALEANEPIDLTNDQNLTGGVITVDPQPTEEPVEPAPTPGDTETPAPTETAVPLDDIPGQSAADQTCSAGNLRASN